MKCLKKLFVLMMVFGLVAFGNVYAEESAIVDDVKVADDGTIVDEDGTALAGDGSFSISDDALLNVAGGLDGDATEEAINRDMDIALESEPKITEEENNVLDMLVVVTVVGIFVVAGIVLLVVKGKKKNAVK